ncbi:MAG: DegT/DnrJ/EryC1/StrS family aminotransferase [Candidatus Saganbacteria bacterium]|nr:DegT/DnrJ/EryC1/StrS family aminotransferase [Candidatus Saganbacteria bacterium]
MPVPFFDLKRQIKRIRPEIDAAVKQVIDSGVFILGPQVAALEEECAKFCGTKFAVAVSSGTEAIHLALRACGIQPGDEVITSPFTFIATAEAIVYVGAKPVFVDIEEENFNIDPKKIEEKITPKTKAILPVHLYGKAADMESIKKIAKKYNLKIIEDCAQAIGAEQNKKKAGSFGDAGAFSFFPTKNLGCFGDGGMITTNDETIANETKILRTHGSRKKYHHNIIGYNSRLDALQAAILRVRLRHLKEWTKNRQKTASIYKKQIKTVTLPATNANEKHVWNQFTIKASNRDELLAKLQENKIGAMVYYPISLHLQEAFINLGYQKGDLPKSEKLQDQVLSLPIFPELTNEEIERVCETVNQYGKS